MAPMRISLRGIDRVDIVRGDERTIARGHAAGADTLTLTLTDRRMSGQHARLSRLSGAWVVEDLTSKNGTWVAGKSVTRLVLDDGDTMIVGHTGVVFRVDGGEEPDLEGAAPPAAPGLSTLSPALAQTFAQLAAAATASTPIEIHGATGTGKELVARAAHTLSRRAGRFVAINCGSLASSLVEGELFGHRKGAYTGAVDERAGLVRSADGGTLFLDEVAELPAAQQAALLRVLQEGEVMPLGADRPVKVDLRIVCATHKSLDAEVAADRFRADLRARLLGVVIALPPLRDRVEDLGLLVTALLDRLAPDRQIAFSADAVAALYAYSWPLNIRELERALGSALAVARDRIELQHLPPPLRAPAPSLMPADPPPPTADDRALRDAVAAAMDRNQGNVAAAARELGKDPTQVRRWLKRFGIRRGER